MPGDVARLTINKGSHSVNKCCRRHLLLAQNVKHCLKMCWKKSIF